MKCTLLGFIGVTLMFIAGCQTMPYQPYARDVKRKPKQGGVVALKLEHNDQDRAKAQSMMESNCGNAAVNVLEEGEVVVGQSTTSNASTTHDEGTSDHQMGTLFGMPITSAGQKPSNNTATSSTTTEVKEWQITYECAQPAKKKR